MRPDHRPHQGPHENAIDGVSLHQNPGPCGDAFGPGHLAGPVVVGILESATKRADGCVEPRLLLANGHGRSLALQALSAPTLSRHTHTSATPIRMSAAVRPTQIPDTPHLSGKHST